MLLLLSSIEKILNPAFYLDKITMSFEVDFFFLKIHFLYWNNQRFAGRCQNSREVICTVYPVLPKGMVTFYVTRVQYQRQEITTGTTWAPVPRSTAPLTHQRDQDTELLHHHKDLCPARYRFIHICFYMNRRAFRSPTEKCPQFNPDSISTLFKWFFFPSLFSPFHFVNITILTGPDLRLKEAILEKKKKSKARGWSTCISDRSSVSMPWVFTASFLKRGVRADNPAGPLLLWNLRLIYR